MSMMHPETVSIAVIGDEDLVNGMRLGGVARYYSIANHSDTLTDVRRALTEAVSDPEIGIIVIQEDYVVHAEDIIGGVRWEKGTTPVIIEVPSKYGTKHEDSSAYQKAFIKQIIGFEVEI